METILIATDFSVAAQKATRYGFELAKTMQAKIILLHSCNYFTTYSYTATHLNIEKIEQISQQRLKEAVGMYGGSGMVEVELLSKKGLVVSNILRVAARNNVSFVIVGMRENAPEARRFFGNTITALSRQSTVPIIVVPEKSEVFVPKKITLASDLYNENSIDTVRPLKRLVEVTNSKLSIVQVVDKHVEQPIEVLMKCSKSDWFLKSLQPQHEFLYEDNEVKAVIEFAETNSIDMLAIIAHRHSFLDRLFNGSTTAHFASNSSIPLLILPSITANETNADKAAQYYCSGRCMSDNNGIPQCNKYRQMEYEYEQEVNQLVEG